MKFLSLVAMLIGFEQTYAEPRLMTAEEAQAITKASLESDNLVLREWKDLIIKRIAIASERGQCSAIASDAATHREGRIYFRSGFIEKLIKLGYTIDFSDHFIHIKWGDPCLKERDGTRFDKKNKFDRRGF